VWLKQHSSWSPEFKTQYHTHKKNQSSSFSNRSHKKFEEWSQVNGQFLVEPMETNEALPEPAQVSDRRLLTPKGKNSTLSQTNAAILWTYVLWTAMMFDNHCPHFQTPFPQDALLLYPVRSGWPGIMILPNLSLPCSWDDRRGPPVRKRYSSFLK
jgi:hypothetical protein